MHIVQSYKLSEEALLEVFEEQSQTALQSTHTMLEKLRRSRRPEMRELPPLSEGIWPVVHALCKNIILSQWFECAISLVIVANSVLIGIESQLSLSGEGIHWADQAEIGFLVIYTLEIAIRATALRWLVFRDGWFIFDFVLVISSFIEQAVSLSTGGSDQQIMIMRLLRLFRLVRTFRMIKQIRSVWRLVYGLMNCGETMLSAFALLGLVLYVFGVLGLKIIREDPVLLANVETRLILEDRFSSLGVTMMTLTQFVTVDSIANIYLPIIRLNPWLSLYFTLLILVVSISLMNLVTATLVEAALEHARQEKEEEQKLASIATKHMLPDIVNLFDAVDADSSGEIVIEEICRFERDGLVPPELLDRASVDSMSELFQQLDVDSSGMVNREEFIEGLLDIFLREVPIYSLQMMKMLRLVRDGQSKMQ
ncbi:NaCP60E, partial [Symbiodinium pilosum]